MKVFETSSRVWGKNIPVKDARTKVQKVLQENICNIKKQLGRPLCAYNRVPGTRSIKEAITRGLSMVDKGPENRFGFYSKCDKKPNRNWCREMNNPIDTS